MSRFKSSITARIDGGFDVEIRKPPEYPHTKMWNVYNGWTHNDTNVRTFKCWYHWTAKLKQKFWLDQAKSQFNDYTKRKAKADRFNERNK